jgi:hypothetical protein
VTITTSYDEWERPSEAVFHDANKRVVLRVTLGRDAAGRLVSEQAQFGDLSPFQALNPNLPPEIPAEERAAVAAVFEQLFGARQEWAKTIYRYDDQGRRVESRRSFTAMNEERTTWEYDDYDNPTRQIGERASREIQFDEYGSVQPANERSSKGEIRFDYKYDVQGNWTERIVWVRPELNPDFQRSNIERRAITYYA